MSEKGRGGVVIISGPSGAGKSTIVRRLLAECSLPLVRSVSATTRAPRPGEVDGNDYHFLSDERFQELRRQDALLECKEVFRQGFWYGTLRGEVSSGLSAGKWVVLEIDVEGMQAVVEQFPQAVTIFLRPSTPEELERRLRGRGTESEEAIRRRLEVARRELAFADQYRHQVMNDSADEAVAEICEILRSRGE